MHYEIDAQINEIYNGKEQAADIAKVIDKVKAKIEDLNSIMDSLQSYLAQFKNFIEELKTNDSNLQNSLHAWKV